LLKINSVAFSKVPITALAIGQSDTTIYI